MPRFEFPVRPRAFPMQDHAAPRPDLHGLCLLLVEDQNALGATLADVATDLGAHVVGPVGTVADALALIERLPEVDAAVLDVNLGHETIYPVADALRERSTPFLFATAQDRRELPERFRDVPLCRKPFGFPEFRQALGRLAVPA
jgi:CheY-like chemotaxis protein